MKTIVAIFDSATQADIAEGDLQANGISRNVMQRFAPSIDENVMTPTTAEMPETGKFGAEQAGGFFEWLFGIAECDATDYDRERNIYEQYIGSGHTILTIDITDAVQGAAVMKILEDHSPTEIKSPPSQS